jgi:hypothetical protein
MADNRPRNGMGQYESAQAGGLNPSTMNAAYNPAVIEQQNQSRRAILEAVSKQKRPQPQIEETAQTGASTVLSARFSSKLVELSAYSKALREVDNIEAWRKAQKGRLAPYPIKTPKPAQKS